MKQFRVFAFCNQKGGVGKTTSAINLAAGLANLGNRVILTDIDPQANATSGLGVEKDRELSTIYQVIVDNIPLAEVLKMTKVENLKLVPSNPDLSGSEVELISLPEREFRIRRSIESLEEPVDYIFVDCPPSLGLLTVNALAASDFVIIPLQCEYYALEGLGQLLQTFSLVKEKLNPGLEIGGVLLTMADFRTRLTEEVIREVRNHFKEKVFETVIPRSVKLSEAPSFGTPGILYDGSSKGAKSYLAVVEEFMKRFPKIVPEEEKMPEEELITREETRG